MEKKKLSRTTRRTIIIATAVLALLGATSTGVYYFLKGNSETSATNAEQIIELSSNETDYKNNSEETDNTNNIEELIVEVTEEEPEISEEIQIQEETITQPVTTPTPVIPTPTPIQETEYIVQKIEEQENTIKTDLVGWIPMNLSIANAGVGVERPVIRYSKQAITESGNTEVATGETITYKICIENNSGRNLENLHIYDNIPEGTELQENSGGVLINNRIAWEIDIENNEVKELTFVVVVTATSGTIKNVAIIEGGKTNETENPIREGIVTVTSIANTTETNIVPVDVVLVLDMSNSMNQNNRATNMVKAVNNVMTTIMSKNSSNRIGIVTFNSSSKTLLELGTYTPNAEGKYLTYSSSTLTTNIKELTAQTSSNLSQGTYTQSGIAQGSNILANSNTKLEGETEKRTPILILLSDGDPTYYTESYDNVENRKSDDALSTSEYDAYYTIKTAAYYKTKIVNNYGTANFYTIGFNTSGIISDTVLNPNETNINLCKNASNNTTAWKLYKIFTTNDEDHYGFNYAEGSYTGEMDDTKLEKILINVINTSISSTNTRDITCDEFINKKLELCNIDITKEFSITCGTIEYKSLSDAITAEVVAQNADSTYYVDLSKITETAQIKITYWTVPIYTNI